MEEKTWADFGPPTPEEIKLDELRRLARQRQVNLERARLFIDSDLKFIREAGEEILNELASSDSRPN